MSTTDGDYSVSIKVHFDGYFAVREDGNARKFSPGRLGLSISACLEVINDDQHLRVLAEAVSSASIMARDDNQESFLDDATILSKSDVMRRCEIAFIKAAEALVDAHELQEEQEARGGE